MLTAKDMKDMIDMYSQFVEDKMLTKGRERLIENALGLTGEAGEVSEKIKKLFRDNRIDDDAVLKELGDVLFYTVALSNIFGGSLIKIIELNMEKLNARVKNGTLQGSGDNRCVRRRLVCHGSGDTLTTLQHGEHTE